MTNLILGLVILAWLGWAAFVTVPFAAARRSRKGRRQ